MVFPVQGTLAILGFQALFSGFAGLINDEDVGFDVSIWVPGLICTCDTVLLQLEKP